MKTKIGYKLFEMDANGVLFPLFINKKEPTPMHEWVHAEIIEEHKGFAHRPGWHIGANAPTAPWLMNAKGEYGSQRGKTFKRVWCEIEYEDRIDYTEIVKRLPQKCFTDRLPINGYYNFKESGDRLWVITDKIKINKILSEKERQDILSRKNINEKENAQPYIDAIRKRMKAS